MKQKVDPLKRKIRLIKPLANLIKRRREKTQGNKIRDKKGDVATNTSGIQRIMREYFENLHSNKLEKTWNKYINF
jgi:hypothetical protein